MLEKVFSDLFIPETRHGIRRVIVGTIRELAASLMD